MRQHSTDNYQFLAKIKLFEILRLKHEFEGTLRLLLKVVLAKKYNNIGAVLDSAFNVIRNIYSYY